jgi:hypothetical protein
VARLLENKQRLAPAWGVRSGAGVMAATPTKKQQPPSPQQSPSLTRQLSARLESPGALTRQLSARIEDVPRQLSTRFEEWSSSLMPSYLYASDLRATLCEGDVFLFKGHKFHDNVIRCCTNSDYNHIAIVVKNGPELELFESTQMGVGCVPLEFYIDSYYWSHMSKQFHKVVVRQLSTAKGRGISRQQRAEFVRYQEEMLGRKFNHNPVTYMKALLAMPHREDMSTSFCSQLVAGAYKRMGILPPEPAASSYFPRDFSASCERAHAQRRRRRRRRRRRACVLTALAACAARRHGRRPPSYGQATDERPPT